MTISKSEKQIKQQSCYQCEGKGYTEIRDCGGEIQRTETCSYCEGQGYVSQYVAVLREEDLTIRK